MEGKPQSPYGRMGFVCNVARPVKKGFSNRARTTANIDDTASHPTDGSLVTARGQDARLAVSLIGQFRYPYKTVYRDRTSTADFLKTYAFHKVRLNIPIIQQHPIILRTIPRIQQVFCTPPFTHRPADRLCRLFIGGRITLGRDLISTVQPAAQIDQSAPVATEWIVLRSRRLGIVRFTQFIQISLSVVT